MATFYTVPKGPLVSFGPTITFHSGRSILQGDWELASTEDTAQLVNSTFEVDLAGLADLSMHGVYTWRYDILCSGTNVKAVQDEITTLLTALRTKNGDGTTGQVGTLTVALLGYTSTNATAQARLISVKSLASYSVRETLALTFLAPQGFSYTA